MAAANDVLITGGAGFVGLAVAEALLKQGKAVSILDRRSVPGEFVEYAKSLPGLLKSDLADVTDKAAIRDMVERYDPDTVVHGAVITSDLVREKSEPENIMRTNLVGTQNVLEALRFSRARRLVHLSTTGVYGDIAHRPGFTDVTIDETVLPDPVTLYAVSKAAAEKLVLRYSEIYGLTSVCARIGVCWGPWEHETGVRDPYSMPLQMLRVARQGGSARLSRNATKDWAYSRDVGRAVATLCDMPQLPSRIYNVAAEETWSISEWGEYLRRAYPDFSYSIGSAGSSSEDPGVEVDAYGTKDRASLNVQRLMKDAGFNFEYTRSIAFDEYFDWANLFSFWRK